MFSKGEENTCSNMSFHADMQHRVTYCNM